MKLFRAAILFFLPFIAAGAVNSDSSSGIPPKVPREFRGMWIATVANIDWPTRRGSSTAQQKAELISILDRAAKLKLNAVVFQVRSVCDAMYASPIEPWSEYLTGTMGKAPEPFYDPLAFAIEEAHKRGLELHAWFNPYRASHLLAKSTPAPSHISRTRPDLVRQYGKQLVLDPGERDVQDYVTRVVMDVVKRYDVDGIHFDDYFYPDIERAANGRIWDFPDDASWQRFGAGGNLSREDWRRENVNTFIQRVYQSIKATKPWVKFGISPAGIWRPAYPSQIRGKDAYALNYADSRKWLANGWLDYFAPQLYWQIGETEHSFPVLLNWWSAQNPKQRHLWPGISVAYANIKKWRRDEIPNQIRLARKQPGVSGQIFYNTTNLLRNAALADILQRDLFSQPALVPASPWLGGAPPGKPILSVSGNPNRLKLTWVPSGTNAVRLWVVQTKIYGDWKTEILPSTIFLKTLSSAPLQILCVTGVDRMGNAGASAVLQIKIPPPKTPRAKSN